MVIATSLSCNLRIPELDALRGLAVLAVLLFHYTSRFDELYGYSSPPSIVFYYGGFGVEFFFAISGFVITWTTSKIRNNFDFFISRFSRLWPAYAVGVVLTWTIVSIFGLPGREVDLPQAIFNLTLLQELFGSPNVDGAYWSLYVELIFYVWTALAIALRLLDHRVVIVCLALAAAIALRAGQDAFGFVIPGRFLKIALANFFPFFAIGIILFDARALGRILWYHFLLLLVSVAAAGYVNHQLIYSLAAGIAALAVFGATFGVMRFLLIRPLLFLGSISYSLYLLHQNIGYVLIREALNSGWAVDMAIIAATLTCVFLAWLLRLSVEVPAQRVIRGWYALRVSTPT